MSELFETVFGDPFSLQPMREFGRMQREMNRMMNQLGVNFPGLGTTLPLPFGTQFQQPSLGGQLLPEGRSYLESAQGETEFFTPLCDVYDMGDHLLIHMELAGVDPNDVNIEFTGKKLMVSGVKREKITEPVGSRFKERNFGPFKRRINVPKGIQEDQIRAKFEFGVLEIQVPKPHKETKLQGKRIPINVQESSEKEGSLKAFKSETGEKILKEGGGKPAETAQTGKSGEEKLAKKSEGEKPKQTEHEELIIVGKPPHFEQTGPDVSQEELKSAPEGMKIGMSTNQAARVHPDSEPKEEAKEGVKEGAKEGEKKEGATSKKEGATSKKGSKKGGASKKA